MRGLVAAGEGFDLVHGDGGDLSNGITAKRDASAASGLAVHLSVIPRGGNTCGAPEPPSCAAGLTDEPLAVREGVQWGSSMRNVLKMALVAAVGTWALAAAAPAVAASAATDAYVANVHPNVDFLDQSSRMALTMSSDTEVRAFAREEATEQTLAGNALVAWTQTRTPEGVAATVGGPVVGGTAVVATAPFDVAADVGNGVGDVLTGRSVAIDMPLAPPLTVTPAPRTPAPGTLLPSEQTELDRLSKLDGRRFDAFYMTTQKDALRQLATLYTDYMRDGDDLALRAMAARQLPIVQHRLAQMHAR